MTLSRWTSGVLFVAAVTLGCTKLSPGKCDGDNDCPSHSCDVGTKSCRTTDAGLGGTAGSAAGAAGFAGGGGAKGGAGGAAGSAGGAGGTVFTCAQCGGSKPICEIDASTCVSCGKVSGSCGSADGGTPVCVPDDGGTNAGTCVACVAHKDCKGATPICELGSDAGASRNTCRACASSADCTQVSSATGVCVTATNTAGGAQPGTCVGCVANSDCTATTKPICELTATNGSAAVNTCRGCAKDSECGGPGVCMKDGHCAISGEVIFVDESAACTGSNDGSAASPYCSLPTGVGQLAKGRNVLIILGAVGERLTLATTQFNPVIIGRKNAAGDAPVIPATNGAGISVSSDTVLIRDITVSGGLQASGTRGVLVSGTAAVTLLRVTVNLGNGGPGIDAETGTTLTMDECYVENNPVGGILVNGATATVQNTLIAANPSAAGYGVQFNAPGSVQFAFNTVVGYATAATSDFSHQVTLSSSILLGTITNCVTDTCVTTASQVQPSFNTTSLQDPKPYHLTAHLKCPGTQPTTFPDQDVDGDPRTSPVDCGADQLVP